MKRSYFRMQNGKVYTNVSVDFKLTKEIFTDLLLDFLTNMTECKTMDSFEVALGAMTKRKMIEEAKFYFFVNGNSHSYDYQYSFSGDSELDDEFRSLIQDRLKQDFPTLFM